MTWEVTCAEAVFDKKKTKTAKKKRKFIPEAGVEVVACRE